MIKIGIMSGASIVPRFVAGIRASGVAEATAIATRDDKKTKQLAKELGISRTYSSYGELVADSELDLIYIPLINNQHFSGAKLALNAGKNVLLEKPFTVTEDETKELFELAKQKKLLLMEAQKALFLPIIHEVKSRILSGEIGKVEWVDIQESRAGSESIPWFLDLSKGGGTLISNASYGLSVLQFLFGTAFDDVQSLHTTRNPLQADDECHLILRKNKLLISLFISSLMRFQSRLEIRGSLGKIIVPDYWKTEDAEIQLNTGKIKKIHFSHPEKSEFVYEIQHIADLLHKGKTESPIVTQALTMTNVKTVEECYKNWYGGNWYNSSN
ncbi:Gfo/Idh/MocA family protein [Lactococcus nasutitermitis]|uniref:Gfo/Idh/MocA family protein n=1 Tax=Lactococcus nasutitermitis TaxID=1652957 RepID=A0ABV9JDJ2_9LACT|nr:Gfo/Idh/MocA family oxidoreductase [Lactococcus nasutitermitis]